MNFAVVVKKNEPKKQVEPQTDMASKLAALASKFK
jgi:hypothetical protein